MKRSVALLGMLLVVVACSTYSVPPRATPSPISTGGPNATASPGTTALPDATAAPQASGPSAQIEVQITGGSHDGSYRTLAAGACHRDSAQNRFSVNYANNAALDGFVALDLVLNDAATATDDESNDFVANISVGGVSGGVSYSIAPRTGDGDGNAFLDESPSAATVEVEMDARDGATIELTVVCDLP